MNVTEIRRPADMERITTPELAQAFIDEQVALIKEQVGDKKVLLALSGGVDSSVAAYLLKEQGYNVIGATMAIWGDRKTPTNFKHNKNACFGPDEKEDIIEAKKTAEKLGIEYHVFDCAKEYNEIVLKYFKSEYLRIEVINIIEL